MCFILAFPFPQLRFLWGHIASAAWDAGVHPGLCFLGCSEHGSRQLRQAHGSFQEHRHVLVFTQHAGTGKMYPVAVAALGNILVQVPGTKKASKHATTSWTTTIELSIVQTCPTCSSIITVFKDPNMTAHRFLCLEVQPGSAGASCGISFAASVATHRQTCLDLASTGVEHTAADAAAAAAQHCSLQIRVAIPVKGPLLPSLLRSGRCCRRQRERERHS